MSAADLGQLDRSLVPIQSLSVDPTNGCVTSLRTAHTALQVNSWGTEFGDWYGFFSQARMGGTNVKVVDGSIDTDTCGASTWAQVDLPRGSWLFEGSELLEKGVIRRTYRLTALADSMLGDFVMRWALPAAQWPTGIAGQDALSHSMANHMHDTSASVLALRSTSGLYTEGELSRWDAPASLQPCSYLRDEPSGSWIAHHRLLADESLCAEYVLRVWRLTLSSKSLPLIGVPFLRRPLWRRAERRPGRRPTIQIGGNARLQQGETLCLDGLLRLCETSPPALSRTVDATRQ